MAETVSLQQKEGWYRLMHTAALCNPTRCRIQPSCKVSASTQCIVHENRHGKALPVHAMVPRRPLGGIRHAFKPTLDPTFQWWTLIRGRGFYISTPWRASGITCGSRCCITTPGCISRIGNERRLAQSSLPRSSNHPRVLPRPHQQQNRLEGGVRSA